MWGKELCAQARKLVWMEPYNCLPRPAHCLELPGAESRKCNWQVSHELVVRLGGCSFICSASPSGNGACLRLPGHCTSQGCRFLRLVGFSGLGTEAQTPPACCKCSTEARM